MITPLDIENKKFGKQMMNGYSVEEVDDFLDDLTVDYSKNYKEISELRSKVDELNASLAHYKTIETTLQNTLLITDARAAAEKQVNELNNEILTKQKSLDDIKKQFDIYKAKMESLLISQLELLKEVNKDNN